MEQCVVPVGAVVDAVGPLIRLVNRSPRGKKYIHLVRRFAAIVERVRDLCNSGPEYTLDHNKTLNSLKDEYIHIDWGICLDPEEVAVMHRDDVARLKPFVRPANCV